MNVCDQEEKHLTGFRNREFRGDLGVLRGEEYGELTGLFGEIA